MCHLHVSLHHSVRELDLETCRKTTTLDPEMPTPRRVQGSSEQLMRSQPCGIMASPALSILLPNVSWKDAIMLTLSKFRANGRVQSKNHRILFLDGVSRKHL